LDQHKGSCSSRISVYQGARPAVNHRLLMATQTAMQTCNHAC
jgi:hypothetical protein